jgi:hypothetical protein
MKAKYKKHSLSKNIIQNHAPIYRVCDPLEKQIKEFFDALNSK